VTGYLSTGNLTADGSSTYGNEWTIAAAHYSVPFDTIVTIDGVGVVRVADRGWLGPNDLDVLVSSPAEAYALTGSYVACFS
jgi:3D (Asp-Asp-Asp) domain-containing protein